MQCSHRDIPDLPLLFGDRFGHVCVRRSSHSMVPQCGFLHSLLRFNMVSSKVFMRAFVYWLIACVFRRKYAAFAGVMLVVYPVVSLLQHCSLATICAQGIPVLFFLLLKRNRDALKADVAEQTSGSTTREPSRSASRSAALRPASSVPRSSSAAQLSTAKGTVVRARQMRSWLRFLLEAYRTEVWFFELLDLAHKVFLVRAAACMCCLLHSCYRLL